MPPLRYLSDVTTLALDVEKCTGCNMCTIVCPHAVFAVESAKAMIKDQDACMECGACALNCPGGAITVDAGVGCASGIIYGALTGTEPTCTDCCATPSERKEQGSQEPASCCEQPAQKDETESGCGCDSC